MGEPRDVLVTGLPRGGTTLTCELLGSLPDTVALDEPLRPRDLFGRQRHARNRLHRQLRAARARFFPFDVTRVCDKIDEFLASTRASVVERGLAVTKHVEGRVLGAKVADERTSDGLRRVLSTRGEIAVDETFPADFLLVVKQNALFAALIPELARRHRVVAVVRNPLSVLSSWQTVPFNVQTGHIPTAEKIDRRLATALRRLDDPVDRQVHVLDWFFGRYAQLDPTAVVRYEDIVASGGAALAPVTPAAASLDQALESRNRASVYDAARRQELGERLLASDGAYWHLYPRESVADLLADAGAGPRGP